MHFSDNQLRADPASHHCLTAYLHLYVRDRLLTMVDGTFTHYPQQRRSE